MPSLFAAVKIIQQIYCLLLIFCFCNAQLFSTIRIKDGAPGFPHYALDGVCWVVFFQLPDGIMGIFGTRGYPQIFFFSFERRDGLYKRLLQLLRVSKLQWSLLTVCRPHRLRAWRGSMCQLTLGFIISIAMILLITCNDLLETNIGHKQDEVYLMSQTR